MPDHPPVFHASQTDWKLIEQAHERVRKSLELLKQLPEPDSFLGRSTMPSILAEERDE